MENHNTIVDIARELGMDRSNARRYCLSMGLQFVRVRTAESKNQLTLALKDEDMEALRAMRARDGFSGRQAREGIEDGYFYIIQVIPEYNPLRVKLGFAANVKARLDAHRTSAPTATLVKAWPCKRAWEQTVIASVVRVGCVLVQNEVYECDSLDAIVSRAEAIFAILPTGEV
jgi:hypothetical protein